MRLTARASLLAASAIVVIALIAWWLQGDDMTALLSPEARAPTRFDADASASPILDEPSDDTDTAKPIALPPKGTPLGRLWATLQAAAQSGESGAACRLAIETVRCVHVARVAETWAASQASEAGELQTLLDFEGAPSSFGRPAEANDPQVEAAFEDMTARTRAAARQCEGLSQDRTDIAISLLRAAALAGQPDAQAVYAAGEGWFLTIPGGMGRPEFEQWRREAPMIVARMLDEGHPEAPGLLAGAYSGQTWLGGLYEADLERATAYLILNGRLTGKPETAERQLTKVPAEITARARQQASALYAKHYAGRPLDKPSYYLGAGTRILQSGLFEGETTPSPCSPTPAVDSPVPQR
jgi:hypothetical protein